MVLSDRRIMITGGAGFIGSHLTERLVAQGNDVTVYDGFNDYYNGKCKNLSRLRGEANFKLVEGDILDYPYLCKAMTSSEIVFHLAAQPGVRYSLLNPAETNRVNTTGTLNVLEAARENGVERLVNASSSSVYGDQVELPIGETAVKKPISIYGASKLVAERYCMIYYQTYGLSVVSLRYFTVYGPRQRPDMAFHRFLRQILEGSPLIIYGDGKQSRDFTYIDDIVCGTIKAAEAECVEGEVFNIGSGRRTELSEAIEIFGEIVGGFDVEYESRKMGDVAHTLADICKAKRMLGYKPKVPLRRGLKRFVEWYLEERHDELQDKRSWGSR